MSKTDICTSPLYIDTVFTVIKANNRFHPKPLFVNGRHSDAFVYIIEGGCHYTFDDGECFLFQKVIFFIWPAGRSIAWTWKRGIIALFIAIFPFAARTQEKAPFTPPKIRQRSISSLKNYITAIYHPRRINFSTASYCFTASITRRYKPPTRNTLEHLPDIKWSRSRSISSKTLTIQAFRSLPLQAW